MNIVHRKVLVTVCAVTLFGFARFNFAAEVTVSRADLPPAVRKTVDEQSKGAIIRRYTRDSEHGQIEFEAEMVTHGHTKDISIAPDGRLLEIEEQVSLSQLPAAAREALQERAGRGKITKVESITKHGRVVAYEAQVLTNGRHSEIQIGPQGERLSHEE